MSQRLKVVYITSSGHSGSTLLDLLVSGHSKVFSVGEVKDFDRSRESRRCTCGAKSPFDCPFWHRIAHHLQTQHGLALDNLNVLNDDLEEFETHNQALFEAVSEESGCRIIVDSSKNTNRLRSLLRCTAIDVEVIHLIRSPFGVAYSNLRKGRSVRRFVFLWAIRLTRTRRLLRNHPHLEVRYERLASRPAEVVSEIMGMLGLPFEPGQLDFAGQDRHNIGGNRMRFSKDSTIALDQAWQSGLDPLQKVTVGLVSKAARAPGVELAYRAIGWITSRWPALITRFRGEDRERPAESTPGGVAALR
jgi:hypothetical protein